VWWEQARKCKGKIKTGGGFRKNGISKGSSWAQEIKTRTFFSNNNKTRTEEHQSDEKEKHPEGQG